ncbi:MAG: SurA N-terminal domain-containing protein [Blastocatellia bacterium]|nr:SurA N-terminal domain-containing protein [Blastocatellia bacterium]
MTAPKNSLVQRFLLSVGLFVCISFGSEAVQGQTTRSVSANSEPFDQIVATVNGEVVTQSDLIWLLVCDPKATVSQVETSELQRILNSKVDQLLLSQEARRLPTLSISPAEVKTAERNIIARFPSEMLFRQRMESVGMTATVLNQIAGEMVKLEKYTDFRFRSFVIVTDDEINTFYRDIVRPRAQAQNVVLPEAPSEEERKKIERILLEKRVNEEMDRALDTARSRAEIVPLAPYAKFLGNNRP